MMKYKILFVLIIAFIGQLYGQSDDNLSYNIMHKAYGDSIVIRVIPNNSYSLMQQIKYGFSIERSEYEQLNDMNNIIWTTMTDKVMPYDNENIKGTTENERAVKKLIDYQLDELKSIGQEADYKSFYQVEKARHLAAVILGTTDKAAGHLLGQYWTDKQVLRQTNYLYKLTFFGADGPNYQQILQAPNVEVEDPDDYILRYNQEKNVVSLFWDIDQTSKSYFCYDIQRSQDQIKWNNLNKVPYLPLYDKSLMDDIEVASYPDTISIGDQWHYRLIGYNYFGEKSIISNPITIQTKDVTPPSVPTIHSLTSKGNFVEVLWSFDDIDQDLLQFDLYSRSQKDSSFTHVKQIDKESIVTEVAAPNEFETEYIVCAVDQSANMACSYSMTYFNIDTIPPPPPSNLTGSIDSSGIVNLSWDPYEEDDLWGYFVYFRNHESEEFVKLSNDPSKEPWFKDTISLKTLSKSIEYTVSALDIRTNLSDFGDSLILKRPDNVAPTPAIFSSYKTTKEGISLIWIPSSFTDVVRQDVYRKSSDINIFNNIASLGPRQGSYLDEDLVPGIDYTYFLRTVDDSENSSDSPSSLTIRSFELKEYPAPEISIIKGKAPKLEWKESKNEIQEVYVYQYTKDNGLRLFQTIEYVGENTWTLPEIEKPNKVKYAIRFKMNDGKMSRYSKITKI